jgi:hypothetical protein
VLSTLNVQAEGSSEPTEKTQQAVQCQLYKTYGLHLRCLTGLSLFSSFTPTLLVFCWDSSVGIAIRYGLDGPEIDSQWGARFSAPQTGPGGYPAFYTMGTGSFPGLKRPGRGVDHPPPSSAKVKERVEQYFYSPSGPS